MKKRKKIEELFTIINNRSLKERDIKGFSSAFIELMAESKIHPRIRREFFLHTHKPSPDLNSIIEFAEDKMGIILENI